MRAYWIIAAALGFLPLCCAADTSTHQSNDDQIPGLISSLSDPDSAVRKQASERLLDIGQPARDQLIKAARSDDPEQRAQAAHILRKLPWWTAQDDDGTRRLLERYGEAPDINRMSIISRLTELNATATVLRLFHEEPSDTVRWFIARQLIFRRDDNIYKIFRRQIPDPNDAPALVITGLAWSERDRTKERTFLEQAIKAEQTRPTNDMGMMYEAIMPLVGDSIETLNIDRAAALLRDQVPRDLDVSRSFIRDSTFPAVSLLSLIALHEYLGPLDRFGWDTQTWSLVPHHSSAIARMVAQLASLGFAPPIPLGLTANFTPQQRELAARFLLVHCSMPDVAEIELRTALSQSENLTDRTNCLAMLSEITAARDDDAETVRILNEFFDAKGANPIDLPDARTEDDLRAELHFRTARLDQAAGNIAKADHEVDQLMDFTPANTDSSIKMVNWLKETNRQPQAKKLFQRVYDASVARINEAIGHPEFQNDLAWLCARSGENLNEAVQYAEAAVKQAPNMAAYLDTLAETKYRTGHAEEAIQLETRALQITPDAKFMKEQLARFKSGKP